MLLIRQIVVKSKSAYRRSDIVTLSPEDLWRTRCLDFGLQSGQIASQTHILGLGDEIRARVNTLYMAATFGGGAAGSFAGVLAWSFGGWTSACGPSLALIAAAGTMLILNWKNEHQSSHMNGE
ncbi:hypothetical protein QA644_34155 (plasmid) [Rhizobium sp. CC1099]|uniref:hypothetical protein n=1 Tax=Rhizobium sp. CC1099 TaxID=3039160 RepID=UPI0024B04948|nr:hypothetical protein [Rhizobium sp. CC1099]WFU92232.1 hypothetical protein QA644_34155 [Rhizobium sp. CC1099]